MGQVTLDKSVVQTRLRQLAALEDQLERTSRDVSALRHAQDADRWTSIPACQQFAQSYAQTLSRLERQLRHLQNKVVEMRTDLHKSAAALLSADEESRERLSAVQTRLDGTADAPSSPADGGQTPQSWGADPGQP